MEEPREAPVGVEVAGDFGAFSVDGVAVFGDDVSAFVEEFSHGSEVIGGVVEFRSRATTQTRRLQDTLAEVAFGDGVVGLEGVSLGDDGAAEPPVELFRDHGVVLVLGDDGTPGEAVVAEFAALVAGDDGGDPTLLVPLEGAPLGVGLAFGIVAGGAG